MFIYSGVPVAPVLPGASFTVGLSLQVVTGGVIQDVRGLSFWMAQSSPGSPFAFQITNRSAPGSFFIDVFPPTPFPQVMDPINRNPNGTQTGTDLGGIIPIGLPGLPSGTYFIADLTFMVLPSAVPGSYTLRNTTSTIPGVGGRISVFNDSEGDTFPIAASPFTVTVVPEPSSIALLCVGLVSAGALAYRRRRGNSLAYFIRKTVQQIL